MNGYVSNINKGFLTGYLRDTQKLSGSLSNVISLTGTISSLGEITGAINFLGKITGELVIPTVVRAEDEYGFYNGEYDVTPTFNDQSLATNQKILRKDVTVFEIPTYETSNQFGVTFII